MEYSSSVPERVYYNKVRKIRKIIKFVISINSREIIMAHNFVKQSDGSKMCSKCGDEIKYFDRVPAYFIVLCISTFDLMNFFFFVRSLCLRSYRRGREIYKSNEFI